MRDRIEKIRYAEILTFAYLFRSGLLLKPAKQMWQDNFFSYRILVRVFIFFSCISNILYLHILKEEVSVYSNSQHFWSKHLPLDSMSYICLAVTVNVDVSQISLDFNWNILEKWMYNQGPQHLVIDNLFRNAVVKAKETRIFRRIFSEMYIQMYQGSFIDTANLGLSDFIDLK